MFIVHPSAYRADSIYKSVNYVHGTIFIYILYLLLIALTAFHSLVPYMCNDIKVESNLNFQGIQTIYVPKNLNCDEKY